MMSEKSEKKEQRTSEGEQQYIDAYDAVPRVKCPRCKNQTPSHAALPYEECSRCGLIFRNPEVE